MQGGSKCRKPVRQEFGVTNLKQHGDPTKATLLANILQEDVELHEFASLCHSSALKISGNEKNLFCFIDHPLFQPVSIDSVSGLRRIQTQARGEWKRRRTMETMIGLLQCRKVLYL